MSFKSLLRRCLSFSYALLGSFDFWYRLAPALQNDGLEATDCILRPPNTLTYSHVLRFFHFTLVSYALV